MKLKRSALKMVNKALLPTGLELAKKYPDFYLHEYSSYEEYRETQIFHNKRKLESVWADERTLDILIERVRKEFSSQQPLFALCHGTRNGFEQNYIASKMSVDVTGTDISETATQFPNSVQWDFHDKNDEWVGRCDFIYTNSLDQSWKPKDALNTWMEQLKTGGLLFIEHTEDHSARNASAMDPFGASPNYMPFILCEWFGHRIAIEIIKSTKSNRKDSKVWLFVLKKL